MLRARHGRSCLPQDGALRARVRERVGQSAAVMEASDVHQGGWLERRERPPEEEEEDPPPVAEREQPLGPSSLLGRLTTAGLSLCQLDNPQAGSQPLQKNGGIRRGLCGSRQLLGRE